MTLGASYQNLNLELSLPERDEEVEDAKIRKVFETMQLLKSEFLAIKEINELLLKGPSDRQKSK